MTVLGVAQIVVFFLIVLALAKPVGVFLSRVFNGHRTFLHPPLRWLEALCYRVGGVDPEQEQRLTQYAISLLAFSAVGFLFVYAILRLQAFLPLNPQPFGAT